MVVTVGVVVGAGTAVATASSTSAGVDHPIARGGGGLAPAAQERPARSAQAPADADAATEAADRPAAFARVEGLELLLPAEEIVVLGFHEAATREPLALEPNGTVVDHQNTTKFDPPPSDAAGPDYVVLSSRGRPMPATSAADLVFPEGIAIRSPVDGEVTDVREYFLYGKYRDHRIEIEPAQAPHLRVVMIHVDGASVAVGDRVVAGETIVARQALRFPFSSHIDRYTEPHRFGHVHLEVKPAPPPGSGDDLDAAGSAGS
ncbi:M23 family metallopeptidase [Egicoccus sp. AB-alg6-2]|uniref:M23 family metallopeptidase n=1 Tax=Egicoccus sp. AB-alg6-2 TaxID=3242692 RepID=UPI00359E29D4